jgi:hypothetical protein
MSQVPFPAGLEAGAQLGRQSRCRSRCHDSERSVSLDMQPGTTQSGRRMVDPNDSESAYAKWRMSLEREMTAGVWISGTIR